MKPGNARKAMDELKQIVGTDVDESLSGSRAAPCSLSEDPDWGELKLALNEAIWTKAPGTTTLEQAEHAACLAIGYLNKCFEANA